MRLSAAQIKEASQCLQYFNFSRKAKLKVKKSIPVSVIDEVFRKAYFQSTETGFKPNWRRLLTWVDRRVFANVDINDEESFRVGKSTSEQILLFLRRWYKEILLPENVLAYPSLTLDYQTGNTVVWSEISVIKLMETPIILDINDVVQHDWQLYNDLEARIQAWLVAEQLQCGDVGYQRLFIGPRGGFEQANVNLSQEAHNRTKRMVSHIASSVERGAIYPSVTPRCIECPFRRRCKI